MIIPSKCPICNNILVYDYLYNACVKSCTNRFNHKFIMRFNRFDDLSSMKYTGKMDITWDFSNKKIFIDSTYELPWFEPDIYNFPHLLDKIKTYVIFS